MYSVKVYCQDRTQIITITFDDSIFGNPLPLPLKNLTNSEGKMKANEYVYRVFF